MNPIPIPSFPHNRNDPEDEGPLDTEDFEDYDLAMHGHFIDEMKKAVEKLKGVSIPNFVKNLWNLVHVLTFLSFCKETRARNIKKTSTHEPRPVNRWEMEAAWFRLLMNSYEKWDPRTKSKHKAKKYALRLKKKILQKRMLQVSYAILL